MKRRDFLQKSVWGTGGLLVAHQGFNSLQWLASRLHGRPTFDSMLILQAALRAGNPFLAQEALADAGAANDTAIITIKVMNLMHTPLCFKLGKRTPTPADPFAVEAYSGVDALGAGERATNLKISMQSKFADPAVYALLDGKGLNLLANNERWAALRLNRWFAGILQSGKQETGAPPALAIDGDFAEFPPPDEVAFQSILHVNQNDQSRNHSYLNMSMLKTDKATGKGGDLAFHLQQNGIIKSPLGLTCFKMGNKTKTTDPTGEVFNHVLASDHATKVADGQSVASYVSLLQQSVSLGFVDNNLMGKFDSLVKTDVSLRQVINDNRFSVSQTLETMKLASGIESKPNAMPNLKSANLQSFGSAASPETSFGESKCEFLAQCFFVKKALDIPNKPFRNFTLLLNMRDMDGDKLDITRTGNGESTHNLSNVEGMRQLALGMNMLAQAIKKHKNVYVVVVTEGGRGANGGDNKVSHSFLMGPGGAGNLKDHLYANAGINDSKNPCVSEPNEGAVIADNSPGLTTNGAGFRALPATDVRTASGSPVASQISTSSVLSGFCKYLENKAGMPTTIPDGFGNYLYIQRNS